MDKIMWWGYKHIDGTFKVKRYFDNADIREAEKSEFVKWTVDAFEANSKEDALKEIQKICNRSVLFMYGKKIIL